MFAVTRECEADHTPPLIREGLIEGERNRSGFIKYAEEPVKDICFTHSPALRTFPRCEKFPSRWAKARKATTFRPPHLAGFS